VSVVAAGTAADNLPSSFVTETCAQPDCATIRQHTQPPPATLPAPPLSLPLCSACLPGESREGRFEAGESGGRGGVK